MFILLLPTRREGETTWWDSNVELEGARMRRERKNIDFIRADTMLQTNKLKICGVSALECVLSIRGTMKELIPGENRFRGKLQSQAWRADLQQEIGKFTSSEVNAPLTRCGVWASVKHDVSPQTRRLLAERSPALFVAFESLKLFETSFIETVKKTSSRCKRTGPMGTFCYTVTGRYSGGRLQPNKYRQSKRVDETVNIK